MPALVSSDYFAQLDSVRVIPGEQQSIVSLASGGFVTSWQANSTSWFQIYDSNGDPSGEPIQFAPPGFWHEAGAAFSLAALPDGGFVATWEAFQTPEDDFVGIGVQMFDSSGGTVGEAFTANSTVFGAQQQPTVTVLESGSFVVAWSVQDDGAGNGIVARMFDSTGAPIGSEFSVNTTTLGNQTYPRSASLPNGGFAIGWADDANHEVGLQFFDANGHPAGTEIDIPSAASAIFDLAVLSSGDVVVVYETARRELAGQIFTSSGAEVGSPFQVNAPTQGTELFPFIASLPTGQFVVSWRSPTSGNNFFEIGNIHAQRFFGDGTKVGEEFAIAATPNGESRPEITSFGSNDLAVFYIRYTDSAVSNLNLQLLYSTIRGTSAADSLTGDGDRDFIYGLGGNDTLIGGSGNDSLDGGAGNDRLTGGAGDDTYYVNRPSDAVVELAGEGSDSVFASGNFTLGDNIENLTLTGSANLYGYGNALDNVLTGNSGSNKLFGLAGNDTLDGGGGADVMRGGTGNDLYYVDRATDKVVENAGQGTDSVFSSVSFTLAANVENLTLRGSAIRATGNTLDNRLVGTSGDNLLNGGSGADVLIGEGGADDLRGGTGADTFIFRDGDFAGLTPSTADRILDFNHAAHDRIDLSRVDADTSADGDQGFTFIGSADFHHAAGELRYEILNGNTYVYGDTDGDGSADFMIRVEGTHPLTSGDFML